MCPFRLNFLLYNVSRYLHQIAGIFSLFKNCNSINMLYLFDDFARSLSGASLSVFVKSSEKNESQHLPVFAVVKTPASFVFF